MTTSILEFLQQKVPLRRITLAAQSQDAFVIPEFSGTTKGDVPIDDLSEYVLRCLSRSSQRHVVVAGNSGVGKTTFLQQIGKLYLQQKEQSGAPPCQALYLNVENISPEESRGFWETIRELISDGTPRLFCIDGFMSIVTRPQGMNNWALIHAITTCPHVFLVATLTRPELELMHAEFSDLASDYSLVTLDEPDQTLLWEMGKKHLRRLQQQHSLPVQETFLAEVIEACQHYLMNDCFPGKLLTVMERCFENRVYDSQASALPEVVSAPLGAKEIALAIKELTGIDGERFSAADRPVLQELLSAEVFGQPEAVEGMAREIEMYLAGLNDAGKPASVVLLAGTTGVGKTELAKAVCKYYSKSKSLRIFTMGNFTEPHSVSAIIGVPPGYVGHELGGPIVNQLLADPFSVFLLDEAEKAHANVWKPFLNLFDEGWITDQRGRRANAEHAIFILTTNAGERQIRQLFEQDESYPTIVDKVKESLLRYRTERGSQSVFSEQFLARINDILVFRPLSRETIQQITAACLQKMVERWHQRLGVQMEYSSELVEQLTAYCFQKDQQSKQREGGRLVRKTIRSSVEASVLEVVRAYGAQALQQKTIVIETAERESGAQDLWQEVPQIHLHVMDKDRCHGLIESSCHS